MRLDAQGDVEHLRGRGHFEVQRPGNLALQPHHIVVMNVPAIFAQMGGDAVGPRLDREQRRAYRIGQRAAACVAHGRDMIDVDAKPKRSHATYPFLLRRRPAAQTAPTLARLPGLIAGVAASSGGSASGA